MARYTLSILYRAVFFLGLTVSAASAEELPISRFKWPDASAGVIAGLAAFFVTGIGALIFIHIRARRKIEQDVVGYSKNAYENECERRRLTTEEKKMLRALLQYLPDPQRPDVIFQSIALFERCLGAHVAKRLETLNTRASMDDEGELLRFLRQKLEFNTLPSEQPLCSTRNIATGQKISIFTVAHGETGTRTSALLAQNTKVVHVGEFYFTVRVYDELRDKLGMFGYSELTIAFVRQGDAAYSVNARVMDVDSESGTISFYHTLELARSQKRQYMRLEVSSPMRFRLIARADKDDKPDMQARSARIADISGGGMSFFADEPLKVGDTIAVTVSLPGESVNGVKSKVLAVAEVEGRTATNYRHHVQYLDIEQRDRERIVKYVFEKQRQMLQMR